MGLTLFGVGYLVMLAAFATCYLVTGGDKEKTGAVSGIALGLYLLGLAGWHFFGGGFA